MVKERKSLSRRNFITKTFSGMASLGFFGLRDKNEAVKESYESELNSKDSVIYRSLGKTGIQVPVVSMGVMNTNEPALVRRACEMGIRHFDTAASYGRGRSEQMIGEVIKELNIRDKTIIATKIPRIPLSVLNQMKSEQIKTHFLDHLHSCLKRLQTDYIDIIYLHDAQSADYLQNDGFRSAMETAKSQKKALFVGFSTHRNMAECLDEATRDGFYDVVLTAFNYSMYENRDLIKSMESASQKGIGIVAMKTQCTQPWYQSDSPESRRFYEGQIMQTALLKWALRHEFISTAIPGIQNFNELEEDFSVAYDLEYTAEENKFLQDRNIKLGMTSVCQQCGACVPTCSMRVNIPALIRTHMYATCYTNFYQARDTLDEIPRGKGLDACVSCEACTAKCVNRVDIAKRINELKVIYI
jgi:predicted aldo/keto reductase-like oxidoreductase